MVCSFLWIPLIKNISGTLYKYLQSVQAYISPPIAAAFLLGVFIKRLNGRGAMASLLTGFALGMARLIAEINKDSLSGFLYQYADINFLHFAVFLFIVCAAVLVVVSLTAPPPSEEKLKDVTYTMTEKAPGKSLLQHQDFRLSMLLVAVVGMIWLYFSG